MFVLVLTWFCFLYNQLRANGSDLGFANKLVMSQSLPKDIDDCKKRGFIGTIGLRGAKSAGAVSLDHTSITEDVEFCTHGCGILHF